MHSSRRRTLVTIIGTVALTVGLALSATPAGARVAAANTEFCTIVSDPGLGIDFEGLGPEEATYAADLLRDAAKTGVPKKLKKDLRKLAKVYDRIGDGEPAADVVGDQQAFITKALIRMSKYTAANCTPAAPGS